MQSRRWLMAATLLAGALPLSGTRPVEGQVQSHDRSDAAVVDFPISCSPAAQAEFDRGIALLHHMTYPGAREAFQAVARIDPRCAMAHWGIAMTLFQPLWPTRPGPPELRQGWENVQTARSLEPPTPREQLWLDAAAAFFDAPESPDYWLRIRRWEHAMERLHAAFPQDPEATAFYALALLATAPPDSVSRAHADSAASLLLTVYARNPDHPGAMHYIIHANDVPGREHEALDIVRKYETIAPRNPHALHMPTHIYTRLGDWEAVTRGNLAAADAALQNPAGERGELVWDEFPHAIEYLVYAYLQTGADSEAASQVDRLLATDRLQPTFKTAFHLASTRARFALERRAWREARSLTPRDPPFLDWDRFPWPEAVTWFARGLGAAREGRVEEADSALHRLAALEAAAAGSGETLFARNIHLLGLQVSAWIAHAKGDEGLSLTRMREAAEIEAATPKHAVTPAPTLPAFELLGDLLLEQSRPAEALMAYRRSLELYPRRFNSLLGAARAARAVGDDATARSHYRALLDVAAPGSPRPGLAEARAFLQQP